MQIPAKVVKVQHVFSATGITQEQVRTGKDLIYGVMIFPDDATQIVFDDQISTNLP